MVLHFLIQGRVQGLVFAGLSIAKPVSCICAAGFAIPKTETWKFVATGQPDDLDDLRKSLRAGPRGSRVDRLIEHTLNEAEAEDLGSFRIEGAW